MKTGNSQSRGAGNSGNSNFYPAQCFYCGNWGHMKRDYSKLKDKGKKIQERFNIAEEELHLPEDAEDFLESKGTYMSDNSFDELGFMTFEKPIAESKNVSNSDTAIVSRAGSTHLGQLWIGDSGCSCLTTNDLSGMYDVESIDENVVARIEKDS